MVTEIRERSRDEVRNELVSRLEAWRIERLLSDSDLCRAIGIGYPHWSAIKHGRAHAGPEILLAVALAIPELRPLVAEAKRQCRGVEAIERLSALGL